MAGDWFPMLYWRTRCPEVVAIAAATGRTRHEVLGGLCDLWSWVQSESADGMVRGVRLAHLPDILGFDPPFWAAVAAVNWLADDPLGIVIPGWENWLGESAKKRVQAAKRARKSRAKNPPPPAPPEQPAGGQVGGNSGTTDDKKEERKSANLTAGGAGCDDRHPPETSDHPESIRNTRSQQEMHADEVVKRKATTVTLPSHAERDKSVTTLHNNTEEKNKTEDPPNPPRTGGDAAAKPARRTRPPDETDPLFAEFWAAYPRRVKKPEAAKAFARLRVGRDLLDRMLAAIDWQRQSPKWVKDGGEFVPYPASWLNQRRWEDERPDVPPPADRDAERARLKAAREEHERSIFA